MTRKHFQAIADSLRMTKPDCTEYSKERYEAHLIQWKTDCTALSYTLGRFNPNFNADRFLTACGLED